jgi:mannopine transport system permease protein
MTEIAALSLDRPLVKARAASVASSPGHRYSTSLSLLLVSPLLILLGFAFVYPIGRLISQSFFSPHFSLAHYARMINEPLYFRILLQTIEIAFIVTLATLVLGYPVALAMVRLNGAWRACIAVCVLIPLWTSVLVRSYAWIVLLQRNGIINNFLVSTGIVSQPLHLIYTEGAVTVAMTHVLLPFMIFPIYAALRTIPDELTRAARNLGAGPFTAFAKVTLPLSLPGVFAGVLMTFILALGFYVTPALVGGPRTMMMATLIGQQATEILDWPFAGALSTVLLTATLILVAGFRKVLSVSKGFENEK